MKRKGVRVMVGFVLVFLLTGIPGVYSASGRTEIGLTYRLNDWGGLKIDTQSGFGGELLLDYSDYTYEDGSKSTYLSFQPSVLYRFKGSLDTSPYVGIGYYSYMDTYENWVGIDRESGFRLLVGLEHFFSEKFSFDLRATACFDTWTATWDSWEEHGTYTTIYVDLGVSIYR